MMYGLHWNSEGEFLYTCVIVKLYFLSYKSVYKNAYLNKLKKKKMLIMTSNTPPVSPH